METEVEGGGLVESCAWPAQVSTCASTPNYGFTASPHNAHSLWLVNAQWKTYFTIGCTDKHATKY